MRSLVQARVDDRLADKDYYTVELKALPADIVWDEGMTRFARITRQALLSRRDGAKMVVGQVDATKHPLVARAGPGIFSDRDQRYDELVSVIVDAAGRMRDPGAAGGDEDAAGAGRQVADRDRRLSARRAGRAAIISPRRQNGLGSERGLAAPSPDEKGREPLSPITVDDAAGTLRQAKTLL
jgi:hypothetical protein